MKRRMQWIGIFEIRNPDTGEIVVENDILADGLDLTLARWAGDTDEVFESIRLEDTNGDTIAEKVADITYTVDESGADPRGELTSRALFAATDVTSAPKAVALLGSLDTVIARATVDLTADRAYEIKRTDYLAEAASVVP